MRSTPAEQHLDAPLPALPSAPDSRDHSRGAAYHLLHDGRLAETEGLSNGLLDADRREEDAHSLHAAVLLAEGRLADALAHASRGLRQKPGHPKLLDLRARIFAAAADDRRYGDRPAFEAPGQSTGVDSLATGTWPGNLVATRIRPPAAPGRLAVSAPTATHPMPRASARRAPSQAFVEKIAPRGSRGTRESEFESAASPRAEDPPA